MQRGRPVILPRLTAAPDRANAWLLGTAPIAWLALGDLLYEPCFLRLSSVVFAPLPEVRSRCSESDHRDEEIGRMKKRYTEDGMDASRGFLDLMEAHPAKSE